MFAFVLVGVIPLAYLGRVLSILGVFPCPVNQSGAVFPDSRLGKYLLVAEFPIGSFSKPIQHVA